MTMLSALCILSAFVLGILVTLFVIKRFPLTVIQNNGRPVVTIGPAEPQPTPRKARVVVMDDEWEAQQEEARRKRNAQA